MMWLAGFFTVFHAAASIYPYFRNPTKIDKELVMQHHELCMMLGIIAMTLANMRG